MNAQSRAQDLLLSGKGILLFRSLLRKSQYWPRERLEAYQYERCSRLLISAYENTSYYHELFWRHDFDPYAAFKSMDDLSKVPLLTKETVRREESRLISARAANDSIEYRTSGSTGEVFKGLHSKKHWIMEQATVRRHWSWLDYRLFDRMAIVRSFVPEPGGPLWKHDRLRNFMFFSAYHLNAENAAEYLRFMAKWKPRILRGYPSSLYVLAKIAADLQISIPPLQGILTASETLLPLYRQTIESVFGAKVFDWYGQMEGSTIITECEAHRGMHINSEYGVCELLADEKLGANERRIVGTALHNEAMPFIRYDTGDVAVIDESGGACPCGRGLPTIKSIRGRSDDFLYTPDGRTIPSVNLYTMMNRYDDVVAFQFVQLRLDVLEVRLRAKHLDAATQAKLLVDLRARFGESIRFEIRVGAEFVQSVDGKKLVVVSKARGSHDPS